MTEKNQKVLSLFVFFALCFGCSSSPLNHVTDATHPVIALLYSSDQMTKITEKDALANYRKAIEMNGGQIEALYVGMDPNSLNKKLSRIQGLLVPGGIDIDPAFYGEKRNSKLETSNRAFDQFEMAVIKYAKKEKLPILGICRGHQLINVEAGGSLYQDIPTMVKGPVTVSHRKQINAKSVPEHHEINVSSDSLIGKLYSVKRMRVNTYHHQGVKKLGPGLKITATSDDGVVEGIQAVDGSFVVGVQFHPEKELPSRQEFNKIFNAFLTEASKTKRN